MKLGKTLKELIAAEKAKEERKKVFAILPIRCEDTNRLVWLEHVERVRQYNVSYEQCFTYYYEIEEANDK